MTSLRSFRLPPQDLLFGLFSFGLVTMLALVLAITPLLLLGDRESAKWLVPLPAGLAVLVVAVGIARWPELLLHLSLLGVILDQWEGLDFTGIPFLTGTKILFLLGIAVLEARVLLRQAASPPFKLPSVALAHLPFSFICLGSALAFAYSLPNGLRWAIAPVTLPFLAIVLAQFVPSRESAIRLVKAFALYSFFPMIMAGFESVTQRRVAGGLDSILYGVDDIFRVAGNFDNPNDFVVLMLFSVPILLLWAFQTRDLILRAVLLGGVVLEGAILVKTYSRSGYISMAFTLLMLALLSRGRLRLVGLSVALAGMVALFAIPDTRERLITLTGVRTEQAGQSQALASLGYRKQLLLIAWTEWTENPVLGVGFSNIGPRAKTYSSLLRNRSTAENTYLETLAEMGVIGFSALLFFLAVAWSSLHTGLRRIRGDVECEPLYVALAAGYYGFAFNSLFDTNIPDNLPWVLLAVLIHLTPRPSATQ